MKEMTNARINIALGLCLICVSVCFTAHVTNGDHEVVPAVAMEAKPTTVYVYVDKVEHYGDHAEVNSRNEIERQAPIRSATTTETLWEYTGIETHEYWLPGIPYPLEHVIPCYTLTTQEVTP